MSKHTEFAIVPLVVETRGEVIKSNVPEFRQMVSDALAAINTDLNTDEDFGQAELDVKSLKQVEANIVEAKAKALSDADKLNELLDELECVSSDVREIRLDLSKKVSRRKAEIKAELIAGALDELQCADGVKARFETMMTGAIKGKSNLESMRKALDVAVITVNETVERNRKAIDAIVEEHGKSLVPDRDVLETRSPEAVQTELHRRVDAAIAEKERQKLLKEKQEAEAKAEAERKAREEAERAAQQEAEASFPPEAIRTTSKSPAPESPATAAQASSKGLPDPPMKKDAAETRQDEEAEWSAFSGLIREAFGPVKAARQKLRHAQNQVRAMMFAKRVSEAWHEVNSIEKEPTP